MPSTSKSIKIRIFKSKKVHWTLCWPHCPPLSLRMSRIIWMALIQFQQQQSQTILCQSIFSTTSSTTTITPTKLNTFMSNSLFSNNNTNSKIFILIFAFLFTKESYRKKHLNAFLIAIQRFFVCWINLFTMFNNPIKFHTSVTKNKV